MRSNCSSAWRNRTASDKDLVVRLLGGSDVGYAKLTRRWWQPIGAALAQRRLLGRPIYFVSSNLHGLVNLVSGYAPRRATTLWSFLEQSGTADPSDGTAVELAAGSAALILLARGRSLHQLRDCEK